MSALFFYILELLKLFFNADNLFVTITISFIKVRELGYDSTRHFGLAAVLLIVAQIGLMAYQIFTVIACCFSVKKDDDEDSALVLASAIIALLQVKN